MYIIFSMYVWIGTFIYKNVHVGCIYYNYIGTYISHTFNILFKFCSVYVYNIFLLVYIFCGVYLDIITQMLM